MARFCSRPALFVALGLVSYVSSMKELSLLSDDIQFECEQQFQAL